jgi:2-keto-4-pentenoate hydratase/2-oxohepta-3-ene-1,7-dioic acid hydratase in catechol pathway
MKWCRFQNGEHASFGLIDGDRVREVLGHPLEAHQVTERSFAVAQTRFLVPIQPPMMYFAGPNFVGHIDAMAQRRGQPPVYPKQPDPHFRSVHALIASGEPIIVPADSCGRLQPEGQLTVVIGKLARKVTLSQALDHVWGYSLSNDITEREWQKTDRTMFRSKNTDTFKPLGPCIATGLDPSDIRITVRHNGKTLVTYSSAEQIWSVATWVHELSQTTTLHPGDCIMMGTQGAAGDMVAGDTIEVESPDIGLLTNTLVAESVAQA